MEKDVSKTINRKIFIGILVILTILPILYLLTQGSPPNITSQNTMNTIITNPKTKSQLMQDGKVKACFVVLIKNSDLKDWRLTMRQLEDRFNNKYNYPYVFLNDKEFDEDFKTYTRSLTKADVEFGLIPKEHWSIPSYVNEDRMNREMSRMHNEGIIYGGSISYRHMCRFESGFFFRHNLTLKYDYYWRIEPGVKFLCDIDFDPFKYMVDNNKLYGFTISLYEFVATIPTLWETVKDFVKERGLEKEYPPNNAMKFLSDDQGQSYNLCHFWSNFEIASFDLLRSQRYLDYFDYLDKKGGFFYERWGDAPVHSIFASLFLNKDEIHFFNQIGYEHPPYNHCPAEKKINLKCHCNPDKSFDFDGYSCSKRWFDLVGHK